MRKITTTKTAKRQTKKSQRTKSGQDSEIFKYPGTAAKAQNEKRQQTNPGAHLLLRLQHLLLGNQPVEQHGFARVDAAAVGQLQLLEERRHFLAAGIHFERESEGKKEGRGGLQHGCRGKSKEHGCSDSIAWNFWKRKIAHIKIGLQIAIIVIRTIPAFAALAILSCIFKKNINLRHPDNPQIYVHKTSN